MADTRWDRVPIDAQSVDAPLSRFAVFLVVTIDDDAAALETVRDEIADLDELVKTVGFRDLDGHLSCNVGIGRRVWDLLHPGGRPAELAEFEPVTGGTHTAPATPGDLLFHIRAERADLCFELERLILSALGGAVAVADEVSGFRYFDSRDLLGFVDGTANPIGAALPESSLIGDEDPEFAGGSYVVVQKYLHSMEAWNALTPSEQERIIGRTKVENVELDSATERRPSHKTLTTIVDDEGVERDILRDNMPFGRPGSNEFGTYFIGYSSRYWVIRRMLEHMFVGDPAGSYDRLLDFSTAITGATFFVPTNTMLQGLADDDDASAPASDSSTEKPARRDGTLGIGSLRAPRSPIDPPRTD
jgi:porphyrinogen peroxidase